MSHWNYRVVHRVTELPGRDPDIIYAIHEAFYDDEGLIWAISQNPAPPSGEDLAELKDDWLSQAKAFDMPVLEYDKIPEPGAVSPCR